VLALDQRLDSASPPDTAYRPRLFRLHSPDDRDALEALLHDRANVVISDTLRRQLAELVKTRHPAQRLSPSEIDTLTTEALGGRLQTEYGAWAYYSWSNRLVHVLDESEFVELRTNRNIYKIAPAERATLASKRIGVVGLSVGQSVAVVLSLERSFGELRLADFDTLDLSNLNRLRAGIHNIGVPKVLVTAREIAEIDPYLHIVCFFDGVTESNLDDFLSSPAPLDLLVEECDSIDLKIQIRHAARRLRIPVIMDTSDRGLLDIERFDREPGRPVFHGLIGDLDPAQLRGLSTEEKIPHVLAIIGPDSMSTRMRASLLEIDQTISTWPQLASSVAMGGAVAADVARRILLEQLTQSGRFFVDVEETVRDSPPEPAPSTESGEPATEPFSMSVTTPHSGGAEVPLDRIRHLVTMASLAPSGGNAQPWRWLWQERALHLWLDTRHSRALLDFQSLASVAALGAAAENLVLAAHADGLGVHVASFPVAAQLRLVATFTFCANGAPSDEAHTADALAEWIEARASNRRSAARAVLGNEVFEALADVVTDTGADVRWLKTEAQLNEVGRLLGAGDRLIFLDRRLHHELMSEVVFDPAHDHLRGIPVETLELSSADRAGLEVSRSWPALALVKEWGGGANLEKMSNKSIASASAFALLTMDNTAPSDYFAGGRAFERLWLAATRLGLGLQPMTALSYLFARVNRGGETELAPATLDGLRGLWPHWARLFSLTGSEAEVLAFRLVVAQPPSARSQRCPVDEILQII
jgi:molybdopterin/thiamine biosynthesis adenylyltransferase/nitroreductase